MYTKTYHVLHLDEFERLLAEHLKPSGASLANLDDLFGWENHGYHFYDVARDHSEHEDDVAAVQSWVDGTWLDSPERYVTLSPVMLLEALADLNVLPLGSYLLLIEWEDGEE